MDKDSLLDDLQQFWNIRQEKIHLHLQETSTAKHDFDKKYNQFKDSIPYDLKPLFMDLIDTDVAVQNMESNTLYQQGFKDCLRILCILK